MSTTMIPRVHAALNSTQPYTSFTVFNDSGTAISCTAFTSTRPEGSNTSPGNRTNSVTGPSVSYVPTTSGDKDAALVKAAGLLLDQLVALLPAGSFPKNFSVGIAGNAPLNGPPTGSPIGPIAP